jgi:hypothetical protein
MDEKLRNDLFLKAQVAAHNAGHGLRMECIRVSQMMLPEIQKTFPNARVFVGYVHEANSRAKTHILAFLQEPGKYRAPLFHAWIDLDNGDLADFTIGLMEAHLPAPYEWTVVDKSAADQHGIAYFPVLEDKNDVERFLRQLMDPSTPGRLEVPNCDCLVSRQNPPDTWLSKIRRLISFSRQ